MQFVADGPDIPDTLLQAHEDGRVVFFCGAGVSYPAGLPGFKGLVDKIYETLGVPFDPLERDAYKDGRYDATLDLLERRIPGQRIAVRQALLGSLESKLNRKGATDTHKALLQLGRSREGALRLVTTNFDRVFEHVLKCSKQSSCAYVAPMLPIPKNSRWDGIVYLHGLLPEKTDDSSLHRLVLTSGDFGLAYLTERWAACFVTELFRNYVVCFVGYSINDPVLRYMMDALAADRMQGEITPKAYALGDCKPGKEDDKIIEWKAKGVEPILYEVPARQRKHSALHNTLKVWAETYRDGVLGKERIVVDYALARPSFSTRQDDFVGRMLWALSHESGLPAKQFADLNPVPPLEWLEAFSEDRYHHDDLSCFGVPPHAGTDDTLQFSLICRPTSYNRAPWMKLVSGGADESPWDNVMSHLARWLMRYLNAPELIIWWAQRGGHLHDSLARLIDEKLDYLARLEQEGKTIKLAEIRAHSPDAIPEPLMQTLWRLLLTRRVKSTRPNLGLYSWKRNLNRHGLTTPLRFELRELLAPKIVLKKAFPWDAEEERSEEPKKIGQLVDIELVLASDRIKSSIRNFTDVRWQAVLPELLEEFQQLLRDALDLLNELGKADARKDRSHWNLPSISLHRQNRGFCDWVTLIELLRDAWLARRSQDQLRATRIAQDWFDMPYPTFKRLALFAASQDDCIAPEEWVDWLLAEDAWWLWAVDTKRETMRLLVLQGNYLMPSAQTRLETAILAGPPRKKYRVDMEPGRWQGLVDRSVWLRLAKLKASGLTLGTDASHRLLGLSDAYPKWQLATNERDEFSHWMTGTGEPDYEESRVIDIAPSKRRELVKWLTKPPLKSHPFHDHEDTWRDTCRTCFDDSFGALYDLSKEDIWPSHRWREALQTWSEDKMIRQSWHLVAPMVETMPDDVLQEILHAIAWWLESVSKLIDRYEEIMLGMCRRVLNLQLELGSGNTQDGQQSEQPVTDAINHPVGLVTQALLNLWLNRKPNDNDLLPSDIGTFFTTLCDPSIGQFRYGRVLLASRLITLFRVDRPWTETHLLPLFDWADNPREARVLWEGFLWSPRLYRPLLIAFKSQFLETAGHYAELGEHNGQFASFLTYAALESFDGYAAEDFRKAIQTLPVVGLQEVARALSRALEGAGEQREEYWKNRIQPFWQHIWPKSRDLMTNGISESLVRLSLAAGTEFPSAIAVLQHWFKPIEYPHYTVYQLKESGLCNQFPEEALCLLNIVIDAQPMGLDELGPCLQAIVKASPALQKDSRYQRLIIYSR